MKSENLFRISKTKILVLGSLFLCILLCVIESLGFVSAMTYKLSVEFEAQNIKPSFSNFLPYFIQALPATPITFYFLLWVMFFPSYATFNFLKKKPSDWWLLFHLPMSLLFGFIFLNIKPYLGQGLQYFISIVYDSSGLLKSIKLRKGISNNSIIYFTQIIESMVPYYAILIFLYGIDFYYKYRDQYTRALQLESLLTTSQLQTLKMQLHPHFLFNALNTITVMIRRNKNKEAIAMTLGLSDMLRSTLTKEYHQLVTLEEEIALLNTYLKIELARFSDRLSVDFDNADDTLNELVPNLILQPIVENAFKHGISRSFEDAHIKIKSYISGNYLIIKVYNTGPELDENHEIGIGLNNTKERLDKLYKDNYLLDIYNEEEGVEVMLQIPIKNNEKPNEQDQSNYN